MFSLLVIFTFHVCGAVSTRFFFHLICSLFCLCCSKLVVFESRLCGGKLVVLFTCVAVSLFCITPLGRQASSFVPRLCGGEKEKKERGRSFVACVAVSLKVCCFVLRPWGGKLVVCITSVGRQACSFVLRPFGSKLVVLCYARLAASLWLCYLCGGKLVGFVACWAASL